MPHEVIMPALGMTQDTGLIVAWHKAPGEPVAAGELLLEIETDKSTMEVEADRDGFVAAVYAAAGDDVPVGKVIAEIADDKPDTPVSATGAERVAEAVAERRVELVAPPAAPRPTATAVVATGDRVLASPKAKRMAATQGLDLKGLVDAGLPQPYHVADLEQLRQPGADVAAAAAPAMAARRVTARVPADGLVAFVDWMATETGTVPEQVALLAAFAGASLRLATDAASLTVAAGKLADARYYLDPDRFPLGKAPASEDGVAALVVRDLSKTALTEVSLGAEAAPVLSVTRDGGDLVVTLECAGEALSGAAALVLTADFAGRLAKPLRHLL